MGQYHYLLNLDKRQVIHPHQIGNGLKLQEQIGWSYSTATVLVMLLAASNKNGGRGGGDFHSPHPLVGSWAGDRIALVGDYAKPEDIPGVNARLIYEQCHRACGAGESTPPVEGWTNISAQVRAMMSSEFGIQYRGDGWLDIVDERQKSARPQLCPDLVITNQPACNPSLN